MNPLISFIIPFFGEADEKLLSKCIESIHEQNMPKEDYEIIIADGKSIGEARNNGLNQVLGKYIFFVDADDYLFRDCLKPCLQLLYNEEPDLLSFLFKKTNSSSRHVPDVKYNKKCAIYDSGSKYMLEHNITGSVCKHLIKKELITTYNIVFVEETLQEDEAFMAKVYLYAGKTIICNHLLYAYTYRTDSIVNSKKHAVERAKDNHNMLLHLYDYLIRNQAILSAIQQEALTRRINFLVIDYIYLLILKNKSIRFLSKELQILKKEGLLPLPHKNYSWKYNICRPLINLFVL